MSKLYVLAIVLFLSCSLVAQVDSVQSNDVSQDTISNAPSDELPQATGVSVSPAHIHFSIEPGERDVRYVTIKNATDKTNKFTVKFNDFDMNGKGKTPFIEAGEGDHSLSRWISVSPTFMELAPGESQKIMLTLDIPDDSLGRRAAWSIMMIEQAEEKKKLDPGRGGGNTMAFGIVPTFAFGVYLYQNPPNVEINKVEIIDFKYLKEDDKNLLTIDAENVGDGISYCTLYIELTNLSTGKQDKLLVKRFTILPELIRDFSFQIPEEFGIGKYSAVGVLDYGSSEELQAAELEFEIE